MKRQSAIELIMGCVYEDEIVVSSTGMICREVYQVNDRELNFYMMGSMGNALAIGIGLALSNKDRTVFVISGDGASLMSLGTIALFNKLNLPNLRHFILDNNCHATTGGQDTCSDYADFGNSTVYQVSNEIGDAPRIPLSPKQITERFRNALLNEQKVKAYC